MSDLRFIRELIGELIEKTAGRLSIQQVKTIASHFHQLSPALSPGDVRIFVHYGNTSSFISGATLTHVGYIPFPDTGMATSTSQSGSWLVGEGTFGVRTNINADLPDDLPAYIPNQEPDFDRHTINAIAVKTVQTRGVTKEMWSLDVLLPVPSMAETNSLIAEIISTL